MTQPKHLVPIVDLATRNGAATRITHALETSGFFGIANHGVAEPIIAEAFAAVRAFFALPLEAKQNVMINSAHRGYMPMADHLDILRGAANFRIFTDSMKAYMQETSDEREGGQHALYFYSEQKNICIKI